jgi:cell division septum initiation protein DivIVA
MIEQVEEGKREPNERPTTLTGSVDGGRHDLVTGTELRTLALPRQFFRGYRRGQVDDLLERAAASIDELTRAVRSTRTELEQSRTTESAPEEVVAQMLATAARIVEATKDDAKREAAALVTRARDEAQQVSQLHDEAQAAVEAARTEAAAMLATVHAEVERATRADRAEADALTAAARTEAGSILAAARAEADALLAGARAEADALLAGASAESDAMTARARTERERLLGDATREASEARVALEQEKTKIDQAIDDLRDTWANRISDALVRLDAIDPGAGETAGAEEAEAESSGSASEGDLALELRDRLGGKVVAPPPAPVEEPDATLGE